MARQINGHGGEGIARARAAFAAALERGDAVAVSAAYTHDATLLPPSAEVMEGRDAIASFWQAGIDVGIADVELHAMALGRQNGLAYEVGLYALRLHAPDGGAVLDRGKYVVVHEHQPDGTWRKTVEMFNPDAPPARTDGRAQEGTRA
ncbi:MAG: DUF4440 domain-containing protein [Gaiellaceae bacterium]